MATKESRNHAQSNPGPIEVARETNALESSLTQTPMAFENINRNLRILFGRGRNPPRRELFSDPHAETVSRDKRFS
jgi:hypothetical protein